MVVPEVVDTTERVIADATRLVKTYHDSRRFSMCRVGIGPSIAQYDTDEILQATLEFAEKYDVMVHGHLAESRYEWEYTQARYGCTPVEWFRRHGLLASASTTPTASSWTSGTSSFWPTVTPALPAARSPICT